MKRLTRKLRQKKGETLVEALAAILIIALSAVMLSGATKTAIALNRRTHDATDALYAELSAAETHKNPTSATLTVTGMLSAPRTVSVDRTGGADELQSYKKK